MIVDYLRIKKNCNVTFLRKLSSGIAFVGSFIFLFPIGFITKDHSWIVIMCVSISIAFLGCNISGLLTSATEIAPKYSSIIMGIINTIAACSGFITTLICGYLKEKFVFLYCLNYLI